MAKKNSETEMIEVIAMRTRVMRVGLRGNHPLICNRMSQKAKQTLLMGGKKKTAAEKQGVAKHDPISEFNSSPYTNDDPAAPTLIEMPATAFKLAIMGAALDMPGAAKSQIGRLLYVNGERVSIYGVPKLLMSITRSADKNRTPDVRTRAIVPNWAAVLDIQFSEPLLNQQTVMNLLAAGGLTQGVGDWRPQKGAGTFGQFFPVGDDDDEFHCIVDGGGRAAQIAAMRDAEPYDDETRELLSWFHAETKRRGLKSAA